MNDFTIDPLVVILAFLLDIVIGDPRWLPHPVRCIGIAISTIEGILRRYLKRPSQERFGGIILALTISASVFGVVFFIEKILFIISINPLLYVFGIIFFVYLTSTTIATRGLVDSALSVINSIEDKDLVSARKNLSMIVGRDTENLSEKRILRATIETLSENLSDGIVAPLFYLSIGGLPLAMTYKAINTLDSMVGYKNERYKYFGWASARLDDIANYIPARITGIIIVFSAFLFNLFKDTRNSLSITWYSLKTMLFEGRKHTSPNAGIPEAAMAGAVGIIIGGPSAYGGLIINKPYIGVERQNSEKLYLEAAKDAISIVKVASTLGLVISVIFLYIKGALCVQII